MVQVLQTSRVTLSQLRQRFGLVETENPQFFTEWVGVETAVSQGDLAAIARICSNFKYLLEEPPLRVASLRFLTLYAFRTSPF